MAIEKKKRFFALAHKHKYPHTRMLTLKWIWFILSNFREQWVQYRHNKKRAKSTLADSNLHLNKKISVHFPLRTWIAMVLVTSGPLMTMTTLDKMQSKHLPIQSPGIDYLRCKTMISDYRESSFQYCFSFLFVLSRNARRHQERT